jgi:hypothetical protein
MCGRIFRSQVSLDFNDAPRKHLAPLAADKNFA